MAVIPPGTVEFTVQETTDAPADSSTPYELSRGFLNRSGSTQEILGSISTNGDEDWVRFGVTFPTLWIVTVQGSGAHPLGDPEVQFVDAVGQPLPTSRYFASEITSERKIYHFSPDQDGNDAFIQVSSASGTETGTYKVTYFPGASYGEGTAKTDRPDLSSGPSLYYAFGGDDLVRGSGVYGDTIFGGDGDDTIFGEDGEDRLFGEAGNDRLNGFHASDRIMGGAGHDHIIGQYGDDTLFGGDGQDELRSGVGDDVMFGGGGDDLLEAWEGNDRLLGGDGADSLFGSFGNDTLTGGAGADEIRGGDGFDLADYADASRSLVLNLDDAMANLGAGAGDVLTSIEVVRGTVFDDAITGNGFRNVLRGNDGNDTLDGAGGTDRLIGGRGDDLLIGGTDTDRMTGGDGADTFIFRVGDGSDFITDFTASEDILRFASGTALTVSNDGTDTTVDYGPDSVSLLGVVLSEADITFEFV